MCVFAHSSNRSAKVLKLSKLSFNRLVLHETCVYSETHMCMPTAVVTVMGWPTLDPWVPPSIDFFYNTHVCVVTAAVGLPKLLNVQNLHMTSSLIR